MSADDLRNALRAIRERADAAARSVEGAQPRIESYHATHKGAIRLQVRCSGFTDARDAEPVVRAIEFGINSAPDVPLLADVVEELANALEAARKAVVRPCNHWDDSCGVCRMNHQQAIGETSVIDAALASAAAKLGGRREAKA